MPRLVSLTQDSEPFLLHSSCTQSCTQFVTKNKPDFGAHAADHLFLTQSCHAICRLRKVLEEGQVLRR